MSTPVPNKVLTKLSSNTEIKIDLVPKEVEIKVLRCGLPGSQQGPEARVLASWSRASLRQTSKYELPGSDVTWYFLGPSIEYQN